MLYSQTSLKNFRAHKRCHVKQNNNTLTVIIKQNTDTPGIRMDNINFPKGSYTIEVEMSFSKNQIFFWIRHKNYEKKKFLRNGVNKMTFTLHSDSILSF